MADKILDASNVGVAKGRPGGYAWVAPEGTALPLDMSQTMDKAAGFQSLGYISEDGVTNSTDTSSDDVKDWGGNVIKSNMSDYSETYQAMFLETRESVLKSTFGEDNVSTDAKGVTHVRHNQNFTKPRVYVFENVAGDDMVCRTIIPRGQVTERDDVTRNNSDMFGYTPTIKALADANGDCAHDYIWVEGEGATEVTRVSLDKSTASVAVGGKLRLIATTTPAITHGNPFRWSSTDEGVAKVDANGNVTPVKAGSCVIVASVGTKSAACALTVTAGA